uniref:HAT C-terminal dimerisation domain-containing protein n=1 Tax=Latimeria chalumnae TaxID=7897 RepID=H2ZS77_LATCH
FTYDLPSSSTFTSELHQWFRMWKDKKTKPSTVSQALEQCDGVFFPNIKCVLQMCTTFLVTSSDCECSISALRLLKTYLHSTMGQERLTALALLYIHRSMTNNKTKVLAEFARRKPQKVLLPSILA